MTTTLVISDTHLTARFDPDKFTFLKKIISNVDRVILNGDIWDSYLASFQSFFNSEWQRLFLLFQKKEAIYIYGNHDREAKNNRSLLKQVMKVTTNKFEITIGSKKYIFMHGHQVVKTPDIYFPWLGNHAFNTAYQFYSQTMAKLFGEKYLRHRRFWNRRLARYQQKMLPDRVLVTGHTHLAEASLPSYYNSGTITHRFGQYLTINPQGVRLSCGRY